MGEQRVIIPYSPRSVFLPFHNRKERWAVIVAHRRAGKTVACVNELIKGALTCDRPNPRFAYIAPLYKQAKDVAWQYLKDFALVVPGAVANESELRVDFPTGGRVRLYGADNPDSLRGIYLDGVVLDEAADMSPRLFDEVIRPALSDRKGWAIWIGTPKGQNEFYDRWQMARANDDYLSIMLKASETGIVDRDELKDAARSMTPEQYAQEYECSFQAAVVGAYYGREMDAADSDGRIVSRLYDPGIEVHTAWDLGMSDHTVIWFYQRVSMDIRLVDYYAAAGFGLDHYAKVLQDRGYKYGEHIFPHDAQVRELGTGKSRVETLQGLGIRPRIAPKLSVEDGINAVRRILPKCWFDRDKTAEGIKALRQYRREWDDKRKVFYERPLHDWASHPADAFRMLAVGMNEAPSSWDKPLKMDYGWIT